MTGEGRNRRYLFGELYMDMSEFLSYLRLPMAVRLI